MKKLVLITLTALSLNAVAMQQELPALQEEQRHDQSVISRETQQEIANRDALHQAEQARAYRDRAVKADHLQNLGATTLSMGFAEGSSAIGIGALANHQNDRPGKDIAGMLFATALVSSVAGAGSVITGDLLTVTKNEGEVVAAGKLADARRAKERKREDDRAIASAERALQGKATCIIQ